MGGSYGLAPPLLPPPPAQPGFGGGSAPTLGGLCWFCHRPPPRVWFGGGTGRTGRGSHPPSLGGAQLSEAPQSPEIGGGGWHHLPWRGGEGGTMPWTPPPKIPLPRLGSTPRMGGGQNTPKQPPLQPHSARPPLQHPPRPGEGGLWLGTAGGGGEGARFGRGTRGPSHGSVPGTAAFARIPRTRLLSSPQGAGRWRSCRGRTCRRLSPGDGARPGMQASWDPHSHPPTGAAGGPGLGWIPVSPVFSSSTAGMRPPCRPQGPGRPVSREWGSQPFPGVPTLPGDPSPMGRP